MSVASLIAGACESGASGLKMFSYQPTPGSTRGKVNRPRNPWKLSTAITRIGP